MLPTDVAAVELRGVGTELQLSVLAFILAFIKLMALQSTSSTVGRLIANSTMRGTVFDVVAQPVGSERKHVGGAMGRQPGVDTG